jgi:GT2 family glycosyltransferase
MSLRVAVVITTRNRLAELRRTCEALARLAPQPDEVLICADGCTDGTADFIRANCAAYRLIEHAEGQGSVPARNEMMRATTADVAVSLDDDSYPLDVDFIERVRALFTAKPRLAVASFPQRSDEFPTSLDQTDFGPSHALGSFANCAAAVRLAVFHELGGYADFFQHTYEEPDLALRCLAAGYEVRFEPGAVIRHHWTTSQRSHMRSHGLHARNELWSVVMRCPMPWLLPVALFRVARQFGYAWKHGARWVVREPLWWMKFLAGLPQCLRARRSIAWARYRAWMLVVRRPGVPEAGRDSRTGGGGRP